jgi:predicted ATPase/class 3 adenylate cyclase
MKEREQLRHAIESIEANRAMLGDAVVDAALTPLREKLAGLDPPSTPERQRKMVTVLFADLKNYTGLSEQLDPESLGEIMNRLWRRLDPIIQDHGGLVVQHTGDGLMALFGAPIAHEDDAERAIRAALALQRELVTGPGPQPLRMRVGLNTGPVLFDDAGGTTQESTAYGDTVNVASRLEQAAPVGGILISHDTYRHVRGVFDTQALEPIVLKGKAGRLQVYLVLKAKPLAFRVSTRGVEGIETRTIGREAELQALQDEFFEVTQQRHLRSITVVGEAGVGKSRLLYELDDWLELSPELFWFFRARSRQGQLRRPFALFCDLFFYRFQIQDSDSVDAARRKLEQGLVQLLEGAPTAVEAAHFLGHLIGLDFSGSPHLQGIRGDARQIHQRAFHHAVQLFSVLAQRQPVVICLEDIHWADDASLDLVQHLARACAALPVMIVCLARNTLFERRPAWGRSEPFERRLDLLPLSKPDSRLLVAEILQRVKDLPPALAELIVGAAEGNPFYIEELIKMFIDDGVILKTGDCWKVEPAQLAAVRVPPTLVGVLQARLDSLPRPERELLERASIIGRIFWEDAVGHLFEQAAAPCGGAGFWNIQDLLASLRAKEMIFRREQSSLAATPEYIFKHALLHRTTYDRVLRPDRLLHHGRIAAWIASRSGSRVEEFSAQIAEHYELAGSKLSAAEWYGRAGKQALAAYAPTEAIGHFRKAIELLAGADAASAHPAAPAWRMQWCESLGEALGAQAQFTAAQEAFTTMRQEAERAGDAVAQARACNGLAFLHERRGEHHESLRFAGLAQALASGADGGTPAQKALARSLYLQGWAYFRLAEAPPLLALGERLLSLCQELDSRSEKANSLKLIGVAHLLLDRFADANRYFQEGLALARELGDRYTVAAMYNNLGESARMSGDYRRAVGFYEQAITLSREIGNSESEMIYLNNLAGALLWLGDEERRTAEGHLRRLVASAGTAVWFSLAETHRFLSEACLLQGKLPDALAAARESLKLTHATDIPLDTGFGWRAIAEVAGHPAYSLAPPGAAPHECDTGLRTKLQTPDACFAESLRAFVSAKARVEQARTLRSWARYEQRRGDREKAAELWHEARALFTETGAAPELQRMEEEPLVSRLESPPLPPQPQTP